jgi:hypothetical protein
MLYTVLLGLTCFGAALGGNLGAVYLVSELAAEQTERKSRSKPPGGRLSPVAIGA